MNNILNYRMVNRIEREFPSLKRGNRISVCDDDDVVTVTGFSPGDCEVFCRDVDSIVYNEFEGRIKGLEWCVVEEYGYVQFSIIPEVTRILR